MLLSSLLPALTIADPPSRSPQDVTDRLDRLIDDIRDKWHRPAIGSSADGSRPGSGEGDVLIVAHGHILRAFAMRWARKTLQDGPTFLLEAGGVGILRSVFPVAGTCRCSEAELCVHLLKLSSLKNCD